MENPLHQPSPSDLSPSLRRFLADRFGTEEDLLKSSYVALELDNRCADLEATLDDLGRRLSETIVAYSSRSEQVSAILRGVKEGLIDLRSSLSVPVQGSAEEGGSEKSERILTEELSALAREVARVETIRAYAEIALRLDCLIGDVEDAVSNSVTGKLKSRNSLNSEENQLRAINSLKEIEGILTSVTATRPQWVRLVSAVDHRVDRALAVLRPQAIADHRSLLTSLKWPPPLSRSNFTNTNPVKTTEFSNPLFSMKGDLKTKYSESFLSLCNLQELQRQRKARQLQGYSLETLIRQPLWVIEELVNPMSRSAEAHFSKWADTPEFVFALVYKIARDFVDSMDEILQPLVDKAKLVGYSCREEWISGIVTALSTYLSKEIFPKYINLLQDSDPNEPSNSAHLQARILWLNLIDLMISFDKRTQTLISNTGLLISIKDEDNLQRISSFSVFCDRPDWIEIWAEIEKLELLDKLKPVIQDERSWTRQSEGTGVTTELDDYKSPIICSSVIQSLSLLIDRARPLPSISLRARFIRLTCGPIIADFFDWILHRCQEAEGLTALADDSALLKVVQSLNAAKYFEFTLSEWCEEMFFLEMESLLEENNGKSVFEKELNKLREFRVEWVEKISTVILKGFDARSRDYIKNKKQWQEKSEGLAVSRTLIGSLDYIQGKIGRLEEGLNAMDFVMVWRNVARGVDQLLFNSVLMSGARFYDSGVERFGNDLSVLFGVFGAWCLRPEGFFPRLYEGLKLLKFKEREVMDGLMNERENWLREKGVRRLSLVEAEKIIKNRVFE